MKLKPILFSLGGAIVLTILPACEHERSVTTTTTEETTVTHPAATTTETHTIRAY